jgi:hypothetical protein
MASPQAGLLWQVPGMGSNPSPVRSHYSKNRGALSLTRWDETLEVTVEGGDLIVTCHRSRFRAVYYKPAGRELVLRERTKTDDFQLLTEAWKAANDKARELGWIV